MLLKDDNKASFSQSIFAVRFEMQFPLLAANALMAASYPGALCAFNTVVDCENL